MKKTSVIFGAGIILLVVWMSLLIWKVQKDGAEIRGARREVSFVSMHILNTDDIRCTVDENGGIYDYNNSLNPTEIVQIQDLQKDENPIKFTFKITEGKAKVLIGDAVGLSEVDGTVLVNNEDKIHIINVWGMNSDNIQGFTIYPKTGFFVWVRMGDLPMLYNSLGYGYGRCL